MRRPPRRPGTGRVGERCPCSILVQGKGSPAVLTQPRGKSEAELHNVARESLKGRASSTLAVLSQEFPGQRQLSRVEAWGAPGQ